MGWHKCYILTTHTPTHEPMNNIITLDNDLHVVNQRDKKHYKTILYHKINHTAEAMMIIIIMTESKIIFVRINITKKKITKAIMARKNAKTYDKL